MTTSPTTYPQRIAAFLAVACLLLQAMAAALHVAGSAAAGPLQSIVICSAHGAQTITIDAEGNQVELPAPAENRQNCPLCVALGTFTLAGPISTVVQCDRTASIEVLRGLHDAAPHGTSVQQPRNRGPPVNSAA